MVDGPDGPRLYARVGSGRAGQGPRQDNAGARGLRWRNELGKKIKQDGGGGGDCGSKGHKSNPGLENTETSS